MSDSDKKPSSNPTPATTTAPATTTSSTAPFAGFTFGFQPSAFTPSAAPAAPAAAADAEDDGDDEKDAAEAEAEVQVEFQPQIHVSEQVQVSLESEEEELFKDKAKLFRWDAGEKTWKERGAGEVKILRHKASGRVRVLMRRDQTFKVCANHYLDGSMTLKPNPGSDKAWNYAVPADFSDGEAKAEVVCIKFKSKELAQQWQQVFDGHKKPTKA